MMQGGTRLILVPVDRLSLLSKLRILGSIKPLINFHIYVLTNDNYIHIGRAYEIDLGVFSR
jgi:hypothetical protein